jgi:hypothetical protein
MLCPCRTVHRNVETPQVQMHVMDGMSRECGSITCHMEREKRWANRPRGHVNVSFYSSVGEGNRQCCVLLFMLSSVLSSGEYALLLLINHITIFATQLLHTSIFLSTMSLTSMVPQLRLLTRGHCHGMARMNRLQTTRMTPSPALLVP